MAYHESIAAKVRTLIADEAGLTEKKMFGGMAFLIGGNMACGVNKEDLIVRVDPGEHQAALAEPGVRPFDLTGRPMKGWLSVGPDGYADVRDLVRQVERGVTYARSLPAKQSKWLPFTFVPPRVLDADEIERQLNDLPAWSGDHESLRRTAVAPDFPTAIRLVNEVAEIAEEMNHHPDMDIRWRRVHFTLRTHVSKGVTQYDIELAHRIERAVRELGAAGDAS